MSFGYTFCVSLFSHTSLLSHLIKSGLKDSSCVLRCVVLWCCDVVVLCCVVMLWCCDTVTFPLVWNWPSWPPPAGPREGWASPWQHPAPDSAAASRESLYPRQQSGPHKGSTAQRGGGRKGDAEMEIEISEELKNSDRGIIDWRKQRRNREAKESRTRNYDFPGSKKRQKHLLLPDL